MQMGILCEAKIFPQTDFAKVQVVTKRKLLGLKMITL